MAKDSEKENLKDILLSLIDVQISHIEHYQTQRSTVSNLLIITSAALLAFITFDKSLNSTDLPLTILLALLGPFGFAFCSKYLERGALHYALYEKYRDTLDTEVLDSTLVGDIKKDLDEEHAKEFPWLKKRIMKISNLWKMFHGLIFALGLFLTIIAWFYPIHQTDARPSIVAPESVINGR
jgi:hypothetical protein